MKIEIDQSGKIEETAVRTVVGDSLGNFVAIKSADKRTVQKLYRLAGLRRLYVIHLFSLLVALLITKTHEGKPIYIVDLEYPGKDTEVLYLITTFLDKLHVSIDKNRLVIQSVGKASKAHATCHYRFKQKGLHQFVIYPMITRLLFPENKKDRSL